MSSWSSGLVQIINRVSTMPHLCETCQEFHFCQVGAIEEFSINLRSQNSCESLMSFWGKNPHLTPTEMFLKFLVELEGSGYWNIFLPLPYGTERVRGYKVCWLQHPLPFPLCKSHSSFKWLLLSQVAPVYSGRRMVCCEKWSSTGVPGVFKGKKHNLLAPESNGGFYLC